MPAQKATTLPVEIWLACWTLCTLQQLRRVSLVCKLFRSLALPRLFREQTLNVSALAWGLGKDNWMDRVRHLHRTAVRLDRLAEGPFPSFVHTWTVTLSRWLMPLSRSHPDIENIHLFDTLNARVLRTFVATLDNYRNLLSLHIELATIDAPLREALESLSKLKELRLRNCHIDDAAGGGLAVDTLEIFQCSADEPIRLASRDTLRILSVNGPAVSSVIAGFGLHVFTKLVSLSVHGMHGTRKGQELFQFLSQCPQLQSLSIESFSGSLPIVTSPTIPLLCNLTGPPAVVQLLTPGRPLATVVILGAPRRDSLRSFCTDISRGTVPLQSLTWPFQHPQFDFLESFMLSSSSTSAPPVFDFLAALSSFFPELKELSLKFPGHMAFRCGGVFHGVSESAPIVVDRRTLVLDDDKAFTGLSLTDDDVSVEPERDDAPSAPIIVKEHINPKPSSSDQEQPVPPFFVSTMEHVLNLIIDDFVSLPPKIEVFRAEEVGSELPPANQHKVLTALVPLYAHLREIQLDARDTSWTRNGDSWARDVAGRREVVKIVPGEKSGEEL
ncbi:hypothetical protein MVEN_01458200 [Mycena venus]|uniref:F-box domain-containing protein n=1 Tax=Mycena venus TaxID=2733690 RepID=A0A8H6XV82_9AGAR|nr:hypothetical protein MVEN_01458200 [Mycena venus]